CRAYNESLSPRASARKLENGRQRRVRPRACAVSRPTEQGIAHPAIAQHSDVAVLTECCDEDARCFATAYGFAGAGVGVVGGAVSNFTFGTCRAPSSVLK